MSADGISDLIKPEIFLVIFPGTTTTAKRGGAGWLNNKRVVFWVWLYISKASYKKMGIFQRGSAPESIPYREYHFPSYPDTHEKRKKVLRDWISFMRSRFNINQIAQFCYRMENEWAFTFDNIHVPRHFREGTDDTEWSWNYIKKKRLFSLSGLQHIQPQNNAERKLLINAFFDTCLIENNPADDLEIKNMLLRKMNAAFYKRKSRARARIHSRNNQQMSASSGADKQVNIRLKDFQYQQLLFIAQKENKSKSEIIKELITRAYRAIQ
ncbi:hypothetical protein [Escherichia coli]|uniref:hypothetical protein n=1 Tax=Escherichia coli TaxID=562 RepID=UPI0002CC8085|nr:hypothetical protein [Escherichia coli]AVP28122.1 hypothetical protein C5097_02245 [Escherichia coli]EAB7524489.1 hypothetical protein [Escherichia coli]EEW3500937.1 hypothetical protein [Escherichia coli]EEZ6918682.1 hypothetical protein [Escherichia coli]EFC4521853.1 hypothetical protein [Escherichia coli]